MFPVLSANGAAGGYQIPNSLRFRSSASAYLNRTPSVAGNRTTWTFSYWTKMSNFGTNRVVLDVSGINTNYGLIFYNNDDKLDFQEAGGGSARLTTNRVYRDPSAWYHIVCVWDTTNPNASDRMRIYTNGVRETSFSNNITPSLNAQSTINTAALTRIGWDTDSHSGWTLDGYLAEVNFIDGQALTPSSFGAFSSTTGVWSPKAYSGTYGTNGFYLKFNNGTSTTTLGYDSSGNSNNWTTNNISLTAGSTYDWMIDSPTSYAGSSYGVGNYCVLNPLSAGRSINSANLQYGGSATGIVKGTIAVSSGKWYWEYQYSGGIDGAVIGVAPSSVSPTITFLGTNGTGTGYGYYSGTGSKYGGSGGQAYGASWSTSDIIGVALDMDAGTLTFYKNNTSQGVAFSGLSGEFVAACGNNTTQDTGAINFGQRPFSYTPPSGYKSLCTYNLPTPTIQQGNKFMDATLYTGNGSTQSIVNAAGFQPDLVWGKDRSSAYDNTLIDSIRGIGKELFSNSTSAENNNPGYNVTAFNTNGFSLATGNQFNRSGDNYVAWQWKASNAAAVTNTAGSITSQVSANTTAGFSVVTYTGTGANATVGHGLGVAPSMVINKARNSAGQNWTVFHAGLVNMTTACVRLNTNEAALTLSNAVAAPTSTTFGVSASTADTSTYVAYCFAAIPGYSAFGSYTGNGSADGPFVYLGLRPKFILIKRTDSTSNWIMLDTSRNTYNVMNSTLWSDLSSAEGTYTILDALSNGFKLRESTNGYNVSSGTYIYAAFAENPFSVALAR